MKMAESGGLLIVLIINPKVRGANFNWDYSSFDHDPRRQKYRLKSTVSPPRPMIMMSKKRMTTKTYLK